MTDEEMQAMVEAETHRANLEKLKPITFEELEKTIRRWIMIVDEGIVKLMCSVIIANKLKDRDPIWIFLIAPSGGGKTELLMGLTELTEIYFMSLLTPNTFLSGMPGGKDASLLPKLSGKIMAFMDWTNLLSINRDALAEIMGQLRDIYGGKMKKVFGTGKERTWEGKVGLIACSTQMVDFQQQRNAALGERFIHYRIKMPDRKLVAKKALRNSEHMPEMRKSIKQAFYAFFKGIEVPNNVENFLPEDIQDEIIKIANFTTMARSGVIRDFGFKKEVIFVPDVEMPTRIVQQLDTLASALQIINGNKFIKTDMDIIYKVALDSIPQTNKIVMLEMAKKDDQETAAIATALGYPTSPIHQYLENLAMLGVCRRSKGGNADKWTLNAEFAQILRTYEGVVEIPMTPAEKAVAIMGGEVEPVQPTLDDIPF